MDLDLFDIVTVLPAMAIETIMPVFDIVTVLPLVEICSE